MIYHKSVTVTDTVGRVVVRVLSYMGVIACAATVLEVYLK